ncbi:Panacea domain-containing protein [Halalkalibacterium halodurans]|uniref:Panacea domain-containing protein n=1 Tax=Halalkalibacterium halodurans TaxID=86665 RepID=UPI0010FEBB70|nr:type II toxin-antitoxin system antitoxin SocA domain-containing protein [Halalkalibacterium halodurans]
MPNNKAIDVANYFVHLALQQGSPLSHLKLQKLLYFAEAHYSLISNEPLFEGSMQKWKLGPVVPEVYHEYKTFGSRNITHIPTKSEVLFDFEKMEFINSKPNDDDVIERIDDNDKQIIKDVFDKYNSSDPYDLVHKTHEHTLWKKDENQILSGVRDLEYDKDEMRHYFRANPELLIEVD